MADIQLRLFKYCENGQLDKVKELYNLYPNNINISANEEKAFRLACKYGHLDIAKWLLEVKPDINISANVEKAFRHACKY